MKKNIVIAFTIFPGSLLVLALVSLIVYFVAELDLASGSANIRLGPFSETIL